MPTIVVSAAGFTRAMEEHFAKRQASLIQATYEVAYRGLADAVATTNAEGLVDLGAYKHGFRVVQQSTRITNSGFRDRRFKVRQPAELRNDTPYAPTIEWGRRPNRPGPPLAPIRAWVERKLGLIGDEADRAAFAIRRHLHLHGSPPRLIMYRTFQKMGPWMKAEAERRLAAGI